MLFFGILIILLLAFFIDPVVFMGALLLLVMAFITIRLLAKKGERKEAERSGHLE